jgi:flagellar FliL protein
MSKSETQSGATGAGSGKKKGLLLIVAAVVVLAAAGAGAWAVLGSGKNSEPAEAASRAPPPTFVTLDPFVVNLAGEVQHYLQVGIDLKVADEHVNEQIKVHLPEIRNGVLLLLSSKEVEELSTLEGKNRLRAEIRDAVNRPLGIHTPAPAAHASGSGQGAKGAAGEPHAGVVEVLLTSFVIQ